MWSLSMDNKHYERRIAQLISRIDHLETELAYLNNILIEVGFQEGINTLKSSVEELIEESLQTPPFRRSWVE
jgi:hypothetical protein